MPVFRSKYPTTIRKRRVGELNEAHVRPSHREIHPYARVRMEKGARVLREGSWKITHTPLARMNENYGGLKVEDAIRLARTHFPTIQLNTVEWGCGAGDALFELAHRFNNTGLRFIGLSGDQYNQWALRKKRIEFYNDAGENFDRYFRFGKKIHCMFSQNGLTRLSDSELHTHMEKLAPRFEHGGILLMEAGFEKIICSHGFRIIDQTKRATMYQKV